MLLGIINALYKFPHIRVCLLRTPRHGQNTNYPPPPITPPHPTSKHLIIPHKPPMLLPAIPFSTTLRVSARSIRPRRHLRLPDKPIFPRLALCSTTTLRSLPVESPRPFFMQFFAPIAARDQTAGYDAAGDKAEEHEPADDYSD